MNRSESARPRSHRPLVLFLFTVAILFTIPVAAEEQSVRPGVNRQYQNPEFSVWLARFETPGREVYDFREEIVDALEIQPGMHVADVGAGTGLFSLLFAGRVGPAGKVYAVDISSTFIENIRRRASSRGLKNIIGIVGTDRDTRLPMNQLDMVFVCDTYHHFEYPQQMLASIYRSLKPGGRLAIIDFRKIPGQSREWILNHVRAGKQTVIKEVTQAGFKLQMDSDLLSENYFLQFNKPVGK